MVDLIDLRLTARCHPVCSPRWLLASAATAAGAARLVMVRGIEGRAHPGAYGDRTDPVARLAALTKAQAVS